MFFAKTFAGTLGIAVKNGAVVKVLMAPQGTALFEHVSDIALRAFSELEEYFGGIRKRFTVPFYIDGTPFQLKVWRAISDIPYGETLSYSHLALRCGVPGAARAAGNACHANPIPFFIPCHRVTAKNGIGGYGFGTELKKTLLELEIRYL